ncbi:uncharacterized protein LOC129580368 [Sitodiplosis mosellana]|uniref:uncharacterized protein LOC129580368 n=1 Tax=Sitodiplosis mosellana TaxID=263140 RepID=UPI00244459F1|nr:uncharacterized protein LOC129580368 [Sitodiplosis mosellana]
MMTRNRSNKLNGDAPQNANVETSDSKNGKATKRTPTSKASESPSAKVSKKASPQALDNPVIDAKSVYDFTMKDTFGKDVPLSKYKGKVLLIVNIASKCGYTKKNYDELNTLQEQYKNKDFQILSFPCNQFGSQMPQKDGEDMMCHLEKRNVKVGDVFQKIDVNGKNAAALYTYLRQKQGDGANVKWNFVKFLVDKKGQPVERLGSSTSPLQIVPKIDKLLAE